MSIRGNLSVASSFCFKRAWVSLSPLGSYRCILNNHTDSNADV